MQHRPPHSIAHNAIEWGSQNVWATRPEEKFRTFLSPQNYPTTICWLMPGDVVADRNRYLWVRKRGPEGTRYATLRYSVGLERNFGVELEAICATETETFACVVVPEDVMDAQRYLMGRGLKLTCRVERFATSAVTSSLKGRLLWWWTVGAASGWNGESGLR